MLFRDQVQILSTWFRDWNECEQTVALFSLMKKVKKHQAKFLSRCLEYDLQDCLELAPLEKEANDPNYLGQLINETRQELVIEILQSHLPLLRPGNGQAKACYLQLLPLVLDFAVKKSTYLKESRQILSYSLIHPAFDNNERTHLTSWLAQLDDRIEDNSTDSGSPITPGYGNDVNHNPIRARGEAPTPPTSWQSPGQSNSLPTHLSNGDLSQFGLTQSALDHDMTDIKLWLKSLRLHKYSDHFAKMSYDEMMQLTEEQLTQKNITKGARDKIILNIARLHERFHKLQEMEKEILSGGSIRTALSELNKIIITPIKKFEPPPDAVKSDPPPGGSQQPSNKALPGDIPSQFTTVMGKICTQLVLSKPDKENIQLYMQLLEKCLDHQAFTDASKQRLKTWKSQMNKNIYRPISRNPITRSIMGFSGNARSVNRSLLPRGNPQRSTTGSQIRSSDVFGLARENIFMPGTQSLLHAKAPLTEAEKKFATHPRQTTRPMYNSSGAEGGSFPPDADISRLDSLCVSVCDYALSGNDALDGVSTL